MAIIESAGRLGATFIAMLQTRVELAAVELEEESQRLLGYLMLGLLSLLLFGIAMLLIALVVILLFWDSYRIEAAVAMAVLFAGGGAWAALRVKASMALRPRLLAATVAELNKDINFVRNLGAGDE